MITPNQCFTCVCQKCHKEWMTQSNKLPAVCRYCKTTKWNDDYTPVSTPKKTILDCVKELTTAQRMTLFESFELCCGMNRGACICEAETLQPNQPIQAEPKDDLTAFIAKAQAKKGIAPSEIIKTEPEPITDNWIEMPTTVENGETLYWHRKIKGAPICYKRETNWDNFA